MASLYQKFFFSKLIMNIKDDIIFYLFYNVFVPSEGTYL